MIRSLVAGLIFSLVATGPALAQASMAAAAAIEQFIVPGYEQLQGAAKREETVLETLCAAPDTAGLDAARDGFADLVKAWSRIEIIRFGPVVEDNRLERILFWPDRRSIGLKQVQGVLATEDETVLALDSLQIKSVALQGLGALEFVLFGTGSDTLASVDGAFRCGYAHTIASAIDEVAGEIVAGWQDPAGIAGRLTAPAESYRDYRTEDEVMSELVGIWGHGVELLRDTRIVPMMGDGPDRPRPRSALFWRSGLSFEMLAWSMQAMRDLYAVSGIADMVVADDRWGAGAFEFEMDNFIRTAGSIEGSTEAVLYDEAGFNKVAYLQILANSLRDIVDGQIAASLGIGLGFSSLDGD